MDWVAVGSVATIGLVAVGLWQIRAASTKNSVDKAVDAPKIIFRIDEGSGSYPFPEGWQVDIGDPRWATQMKMVSDLKKFNTCVIRIKNPNDYRITGIKLELRATDVWSMKVENTKILAKSAVLLSINESGLHIDIDEFPSNDEVRISVVAGGVLFSNLSVRNAAVKLENKGLWDA